MIIAKIFRNEQNEIYGFTVKNHDEGIVCASVSVLVLNTVNCIEHFTDEKFKCDYKEEGGYINLSLPAIKTGAKNEKVKLLLDSMLFGLTGIKDEYPGSIRIKDII